MADRSITDAAIPADGPARARAAAPEARFYRHIADSVSDAIITLKPDATIKSWNRAAESIYGWTAAEAVGRNAIELLRAAFPGSSFREISARLSERGRLEFETVHTARNGRKLTMLSHAALHRGADGKVKGCVAVMRDITERRAREEAGKLARELAQAKRLLEDDLNAMNRLHGIGTRFVQRQDFPTLMDEIAEAATETTRAGICTIQAFEASSGFLRLAAHRGLPAGLGKEIEAAHNRRGVLERLTGLAGRLIVEDAAARPDLMGPRGGEAMLAMGMRSMCCTPLMNRSGRMLGVLTIYFTAPHCFDDRELRFLDLLARMTADILERTNTEDILQRSSQSTELLYEVVEMLLEGNDAQGIIQELCTRVMRFLGCDLFFNYLFSPDDPDTLRLNACGGVDGKDAEVLGTIARGQLVCGCVADTGARIVVEDVQHSADERVAFAKARGIRVFACHPLTVRDEVLGTLAFGSSTRDAFDAGELALMRAVCSHVAAAVNRLRTESDLKGLANELREKNKLITDFFTNISHEFKTPLSIILVDLQLMEYRLRDTGDETREKLGRMIAVMRQNALRLLRLIGNLLDVTKIDAGFMRTRFVSTDIVALIAGLVESVRDYADNAGITLDFKSDRSARTMPADTEKMERVMLNLLSNAIKHTAEGGRISVEMRHDEGSVTIRVKDDGEGIPDDKKELVFDRFRQVNTSLTRSNEGCGIGLSLTKALVELLQGRIWFESRFGSGSEFFVELPVLAEAGHAQTPEVEGMPRNRKVEMEFSDIHKAGRQL